MRKYLLVVLIITCILAGGAYALNRKKPSCPLENTLSLQGQNQNIAIERALGLLKVRKDEEARVIYENILAAAPQNIEALWGKAEILRRQYRLGEAEGILQQILKTKPNHLPSLNNLAYMRYKQNKIEEALKIIKKILDGPCMDKENQAFAYLTLGAINSQRSAKGLLFSKLQYGRQIRGDLERARALCPELAEVHLGLGIYFMKAPLLAGGNINKAISELELALKIAPDYALACARLAQAYQKKGDLKKYNFYLQRTKALDPKNYALKECEI